MTDGADAGVDAGAELAAASGTTSAIAEPDDYAARDSLRARTLVAALVTAVPALVLYWRTLTPDVSFWDTGEFQTVGPILGIAHPTGYPTYTMLLWLASVVLQPFGNEAVRANLFSAIAIAGAVGLTSAIVTRLTGRMLIGIAAGVTLAVGTQVWTISNHADPHALHLLFATILLLLLVIWQDRQNAGSEKADRWLVAAAVAYGIALGNHGLTYMLAPGIALFVLAARPRILLQWRLLVACFGAVLLSAAAVYAYLPIASAMNPPMDYGNPQTLEGFRYVVFAQQFGGMFVSPPTFEEAFRTITTVTIEQVGILSVLALVGAVGLAWRRPALLFLLGGWFLATWIFALVYPATDIGRYYLVPIMCAAVLGGVGAGVIVDGIVKVLSSNQDMARTVGIVTAAVAGLALITASVVAVPDRFGLVDASNDHSARRWLASVTEELPQNSVVVSWWSYSTTLWYGQYVEHRRPDVTVIDDSTIVQQDLGSAREVVDSYLGKRPVFLIRTAGDLPQYEAIYVLTPLPGVVGGPVYEVEGMKADASERNGYL